MVQIQILQLNQQSVLLSWFHHRSPHYHLQLMQYRHHHVQHLLKNHRNRLPHKVLPHHLSPASQQRMELVSVLYRNLVVHTSRHLMMLLRRPVQQIRLKPAHPQSQVSIRILIITSKGQVIRVTKETKASSVHLALNRVMSHPEKRRRARLASRCTNTPFLKR